ncbi:hypothetical protein SESBI_48298 [Sesbania bispinosa]|nr:hypothetical protein SESBI_48298 [Sesbania bispinosa]
MDKLVLEELRREVASFKRELKEGHQGITTFEGDVTYMWLIHLMQHFDMKGKKEEELKLVMEAMEGRTCIPMAPIVGY